VYLLFAEYILVKFVEFKTVESQKTIVVDFFHSRHAEKLSFFGAELIQYHCVLVSEAVLGLVEWGKV